MVDKIIDRESSTTIEAQPVTVITAHGKSIVTCSEIFLHFETDGKSIGISLA